MEILDPKGWTGKGECQRKFDLKSIGEEGGNYIQEFMDLQILQNLCFLAWGQKMGKYVLRYNSCSLPVLNPPGPTLTSNYQASIHFVRKQILFSF